MSYNDENVIPAKFLKGNSGMPRLTSINLASALIKKQGISPVFFREEIMHTLLLLAALSNQIT
ncbi:hypothetical protein MJN39_24315, partial [Salmonella enterica subsp. enterica serovar Kentucky]|nr:hypothetical protein [Salmonella enterica subsp. enterica serovar Kentucky]